MSPFRTLAGPVVRFLLVLLACQFAWSQARGTAVERAVIDGATVGSAVTLIHFLSPTLAVQGTGPRITAPGGGINILNGCEGTEALFLLFGALAAADLRMFSRLAGIILGTLWIFALNQVRIVALFYSYRADRALFDQLHGLVAPLILVLLTLVFFAALLQFDGHARAGTPEQAL